MLTSHTWRSSGAIVKTGVRCTSTSTYHELRTLNVSWAETWRHKNTLVHVFRLVAVNKWLSSSSPDLIGFCVVPKKLVPKSAPHLRQTPQFDFTMLSHDPKHHRLGVVTQLNVYEQI
jgi:hypothetical protein